MYLYAGPLCETLLYGRGHFVLQFLISSNFLFCHLVHLFPIIFSHRLPLLLIFHFIVFHFSLSSSIPSFSLCLLYSSSLLFFPVLSSLSYLSLIFLFIILFVHSFFCDLHSLSLHLLLIYLLLNPSLSSLSSLYSSNVFFIHFLFLSYLPYFPYYISLVTH